MYVVNASRSVTPGPFAIRSATGRCAARNSTYSRCSRAVSHQERTFAASSPPSPPPADR